MIHSTHPDVAVRARLPHRPIRLASTKDLPQQDWLAIRQQGIGSSDAAAAVGLNPYQSMLELWLIKTGRQASIVSDSPANPQDNPTPNQQSNPQPNHQTSHQTNLDQADPMYWGKILEPIVAQHYQQRTGAKVRRVNAVLQHPEQPWMLANLDYRISGDSSVGILECKTAGEFGARRWKDGVPDDIQLQVQHQLAVTGEHAADVAVLICGQRLQIHRIHRDDALINRLIALEQQFWHYVETDTAPPADGSASAQHALQQLYPRDSGLVLDWQDNEVLSAAFDALIDVRTELEACQQHEDQLKQRIQQAMGDASQAVFAHGSVSWKRSKDSSSLDHKRLLNDQPHLLEQYSISKAGSRRFLVQVNAN